MLNFLKNGFTLGKMGKKILGDPPQKIFAVKVWILPHDGFGTFMLKHFRNIGSPLNSISIYPRLSDEETRFRRLGWKSVYCSNMLTVYENSLPLDRKNQVEQLEPFDEYEMWHQKCVHYAFIVASNLDRFSDSFCKEFKLQKQEYVFDVDSSAAYLQTKKSLPLVERFCDINIEKHDFDQKRFGHKCVLMPGEEFMLVSGGWGSENDGYQRRLDTLAVVDVEKWTTLYSLNDHAFSRCYHTFTPLYHQNSALIFGGRLSPKRPFNTCVVVSFSKETNRPVVKFEELKISAESERPLPRWRHAACNVEYGKIFVCGGLTWPTETLRDSWIIHVTIDNNEIVGQWERLSDMPVPLHSHTCCKIGDRIFVIGGLLDAGSTVSRRVLIFDLSTKSWTSNIDAREKDTAYLLTRGIYGHTCHSLSLENNVVILVLIGGILENGEENAGALMLRLNDQWSAKSHMTWKEIPETWEESREAITEYFSPVGDSEHILTNHDSCWSQQSINTIFIIGGGGNCFSFGTMFNQRVLSAKICV